MKLVHYLAIFSTLLALVTVSTVSVYHNGIMNSCTSQYHMDIDIPGLRLASNIEFFSSTSRAHQYFTNVSGRVKVNDKDYQINREQVWDYELRDRKSGLMKIIFSRENANASDTVQGTEVDTFIMGKEKGGRQIKIWRINDDILLTGNPYSPIYACVRMR